MVAPIVQRLRKAIASERNSCKRACLTADLACYLARVGAFGAAEEIKTTLRKDYGKGEDARVSIRLMCLDALLIYYRGTSPSSKDRMARAYLISQSLGEKFLIALTSSWLAHFNYNYKMVDEMARDIEVCFDHLAWDDGSAECRVSMVLGDAFLFSGNAAASHYWYERARNLAVVLGDQAVLGAIVFNRAALIASALRFSAFRGVITEAALLRAEAEVANTVNYQALSDQLSLAYLIQTLQINIHLLKEEYEEAGELLDAVLAVDDLASRPGHLLLYQTDQILVLAKTGKQQVALQKLDDIIESYDVPGEHDDKAVIFNSIGVVLRECGRIEEAIRWHKMRDQEVDRHLAVLSKMKLLITKYECSNSNRRSNRPQ